MTRGRKRQFDPTIPAHINQNLLPDGCYWDKSGKGHWYTKFKDDTGRWRRKRIAGPSARMSDLHQLIEEFNGIDKNTLRYLCNKYFESDRYLKLKS